MTQSKFKELKLFAPLSGRTIALDDVPDPVFAEKMVGDGISIIPTSFVLCAPTDATVSTIHSSHHALSLATPQGIDLLMHIGLETVLLKTKGFTLKVKIGQNVKKGDPLIEFDPDFIAKNAKSLMTEIVITNGDKVSKMTPLIGKDVVAGKDEILTLTLKEAGVIEPQKKEHLTKALSWEITIVNPVGLHARPVAVLANAAKKFHADIFLTHNDTKANAKSVVAVMGLDIKKDDRVRLLAKGPDAVNALKELIPLLQDGLGEDLNAAPVALEPPPPQNVQKTTKENEFAGIPASKGQAVGVVVQLTEREIKICEIADSPDQEQEKLTLALAQAIEELNSLHDQMLTQADAGKASIFKAHIELIQDPELLEYAQKLIKQGKSAGFAWSKAVKIQATMLAELKNELLAGRANDLKDIGKRVLLLLSGETKQEFDLPDNTILIATDLTPSDTATLDRAKVVGFCTTLGGATSHVSILARTLSLPAIVGIDTKALSIPNGASVLLDGTTGLLKLDPSEKDKEIATQYQKQELAQRTAYLADKMKPALTLDGEKIEIVGNIGGLADAQQVIALGGEGVGLLRSEFLFLQRNTPPTEEEQTEIYTKIAQAMGKDRSLIVRTLDVGGDKPLSYLPMPKEDNPFLGVRGIRLTLMKEDIFRTQIRAVLKASGHTKMRLMFPMITTLSELVKAKEIVEQERSLLNVAKIEIGIMIEVPAAAIMADVLAPHVDFFSIGTNDLTQYVLAMDRGNAEIARQANGLEPAVLRMIASTVNGAKKHNKWVGVCGGLASEEEAIPVLIGLGVDELSVIAAAIPAIKAQVRRLNLIKCQKLAETLLHLTSAKEVQDKISEFQTKK